MRGLPSNCINLRKMLQRRTFQPFCRKLVKWRHARPDRNKKGWNDPDVPRVEEVLRCPTQLFAVVWRAKKEGNNQSIRRKDQSNRPYKTFEKCKCFRQSWIFFIEPLKSYLKDRLRLSFVQIVIRILERFIDFPK